MKLAIKTSIIIEASKETIWNILIDFERYPEWNPFIKSISGSPIVGEILKADIGDMKFKPTVLVAEEHDELKWLGHLLFRGLFDGEHHFKLVEMDQNTVEFEQNENFSGILVGLFSNKLNTETKEGFEAMNLALKLRAEAI